MDQQPHWRIERISSLEERIEELAELLIEVVEDGASIGFLPPVSRAEALDYWNSVLKPDVCLLVAVMNERVAGTVQVHYTTKANGSHRAEIAKLMTSPANRRNGIGRALMQRAEQTARENDVSLLVLDTREGDPSNLLYGSIGYIQAGMIPDYAKSANGELHATVLYYKKL